MEEEKALARVRIGELTYTQKEGSPPNVLYPFYKCYVITTCGQIWDVWCAAFSCTKERITELWNSNRSLFVKRDQSTV